jgi:hypothetical protein
MATRASIKFKDSDGRFIANVYNHYDGYPSGLGVKLLELTKGVVVNGLSPGEYLGKRVFNGFGCLAASVIEGLKDRPGNVYLYSESDYGNAGEEYLYEVVESEDGCQVLVKSLHSMEAMVDGEFVPVEDILETESND